MTRFRWPDWLEPLARQMEDGVTFPKIGQREPFPTIPVTTGVDLAKGRDRTFVHYTTSAGTMRAEEIMPGDDDKAERVMMEARAAIARAQERALADALAHGFGGILTTMDLGTVESERIDPADMLALPAPKETDT